MRRRAGRAVLIIATTAQHAAADESTDERGAERDQRWLLDLLLDIHILFLSVQALDNATHTNIASASSASLGALSDSDHG